MKKIYALLLLFSLFRAHFYAQNKYDYIWTLGYGDIAPGPGGYPYGGVIMDFNVDPPSLTLQDYVVDRPKAAISSPEGQLIAYTDGCRVLNRQHQIMLNGDTLSPGKVFNNYCDVVSYPSWQPTIFLPKPGSDSLYYLFHLRGDDYSYNPMDLMYSVVDASADNGNGAVIEKNRVILSDSIFLGTYVTATRHGDGRDWWIVMPRRYSNNIYVSLLTEHGVQYMGMQNFDTLGFEIDSVYWGSQTAFSQDGSKYFRNSPKNLIIYDFDRCSGLLSNPVRLDWDSLPYGGGGVATSPDSRFMYLSSGGTIQQYDLWAADIAGSMQVVAQYDGTLAPFPTNFFQMMPGPDGKIYVITSHDNNVLHVIEHPNEWGTACTVVQHAITLPARQSYVMVNFANFHLGAQDPPCPPPVSGTDAPATVDWVKVQPNPVSQWLSLEASDEIGPLNLYNTAGMQCRLGQIVRSGSRVDVDMGGLSPGLYYVVTTVRGKAFGKRVFKQ